MLRVLSQYRYQGTAAGIGSLVIGAIPPEMKAMLFDLRAIGGYAAGASLVQPNQKL